MKQLLEVASLISKKKVKKIDTFNDNSSKIQNTKFDDFFEALISDKIKTDEEAAQFLYGSSATDDKYRQLKSRFKKRLTSTLFLIDTDQFSTSNYDRTSIRCQKDWVLVKILIINKAYKSALILAKSLLNTALKYKFTNVIIDCSRLLREYYALDSRDESEFELYDKYCKQYQNILDAEIRSEELYQRINFNYNRISLENKNLVNNVMVYCEALENLDGLYDSPYVSYYKFLMYITRHEILAEYQEMLNACENAELFISKNSIYFNEDKIGVVFQKKISAILHLRKCYNFFDKAPGLNLNNIYFRPDVIEYSILLALHCKEYSHAFNLYSSIIKDKNFNSLTELQKEKFYVIEVYLNYLLLIADKIDLDLTEINQNIKKIKRFRLRKFLNEQILYPKAMRPIQALLTIAQILFLILEKKLKEAALKTEELKSFSTRQLNKDHDFRTIQFINLLYLLSKSGFKSVKNQNSYKYLKNLSNVPFRYRGLLNELEVIPYEQLWELTLQNLD